MTKKIKIYLSLVFCLVGILFFNFAFAQQALPQGGSGFDTAVKIAPGQYQGFTLEADQSVYYYFEAKPGQLAHFKDIFVSVDEDNSTWNEIALYNGSENKLISRDEYQDNKVEISWLLNSSEISDKIYVQIHDDGSGTKSFTLDFSLTDKSDANSGTDGGDTFDKFVNITPGKYSGYLSGYDSVVNQVGNDLKDNYKIGIKKGTPYEFKLTPPSKASLTLSLYNSDNQLLKEETSANEGAVVSLPLTTPSADTNIFVSVSIYMPVFYAEIADYQLEIKSSVPFIKFYACDVQYCGEAGEFDSLDNCQKTTTKTCYQTENCDDKCAITPPPVQCAKDADCSTGKICQGNKCVEKSPLLPIAQCAKDSDCNVGLICKDNQCQSSAPVAGCAKDSDCLTGQVCKDGKCEASTPVVGCVKDSDCLTGNICKGGKCEVLPGAINSPTVAPKSGLLGNSAGSTKLNWTYISIIGVMIALAIIVLILFLRKKPEKKENIPTATFSGSTEADKPTVGYKHPCKYCDKLIPPNSTVCPFCEKLNPLGPSHCPKCHEPVRKNWKACSHCGQNLRIVCSKCEKVTFFGDYCEDCDVRLLATCPHCGQEQPPISDNCIKCGRPLQKNNS